MTELVQRMLHEQLAPQIDYVNTELWPAAVDLWVKLDVPSWEVYQPAFQECTADVWKASQSMAHLTYLTFKPLAILGQIVFRILLQQAWVSLEKGLLQLKLSLIWLYHFQMGLSRVEILGELVVVLLVVASYYLYKWMQRQTYWARFVGWYSGKKQIVIEKTTKTVERIARVSLILAMAVPHAAFLGGYVVFKLLFPSVVKWLAYDTYMTGLISVWYPLFMTLSWIHDKKQMIVEEKAHAEKEDKENKAPLTSKKDRTPSTKSRSKTGHLTPPNKRQGSLTLETTPTKKPDLRSSAGRKPKTKPFPRTAPPTPETPIRQRTAKKRPISPTLSIFINEPERATRYWLRYWIVFALVQSLGTFGGLVPVFGSFVARHPYVLHICCELKLLFFIWVFFMEKLIGAAVPDEKALMAQTMPLQLLHNHIAPLILEFEAVVAESVSKETWTTVVVSKLQRILDVFVMLKMVTEPFKDWLIHLLEEGRPLLLPSLSLFMPGFVTQFGVAYAQYVVPSSKSAKALGSGRGKHSTHENEAKEILYLQYWVLHCLVGGFLSYFSSIIWWIPFSTHAIFIGWCYLSFPKTITLYYEYLEMELTAFGLLPGEAKIDIHETRTAQVLQAVYKRLPTASDSDLGKSMSQEESESSDALDQSLSTDSAQTDAAVAFRSKKSMSMDEDDPPAPISEEEEFDPKGSGSSRRSNKYSSSQRSSKSDDEEDEWLPASKSDLSMSTARTETTLSDVSASTNNATTSMRRSTRQRKKNFAQ